MLAIETNPETYGKILINSFENQYLITRDILELYGKHLLKGINE